MKKIFIADHHPVTRKGIACMLKKNDNFEIIGKANNGDELYKSLQEEKPDILIMEIDMPHINGINALRGIKTEFPEVRVLIFSTHPEEIYAFHKVRCRRLCPQNRLHKSVPKSIKTDR